MAAYEICLIYPYIFRQNFFNSVLFEFDKLILKKEFNS